MSKSKHNNLPSKAYKSILTKVYVMVFVVIASAGTGYYIIQLNNILQDIYKPNEASTSTKDETKPISQSLIDSLSKLNESANSKVIELPTSTRTNPFN